MKQIAVPGRSIAKDIERWPLQPCTFFLFPAGRVWARRALSVFLTVLEF